MVDFWKYIREKSMGSRATVTMRSMAGVVLSGKDTVVHERGSMTSMPRDFPA